MNIDVEFTGDESPAEIVEAAIAEFVRQLHPANVTIFYDNSIPKMRYEFHSGYVDFSCTYRLDTMLEPFYGEAEKIFNELANLGIVNTALRPFFVRYIAFAGMTTMLSRLMILQAEIFSENLEDARITARSLFLQSLIATYGTPDKKASDTKAASAIVKQWIDDLADDAMKKKRDYLVGFMNVQPLFNIPTGIGRPKGSTKPEEQKKQEKKEFEKRIENTVRTLFAKTGRIPNKTDVADALGTGGVNPSTGSDTRLNSLNNKLNRLGIDYSDLIQSLNLHE